MKALNTIRIRPIALSDFMIYRQSLSMDGWTSPAFAAAKTGKALG